MILTAGTSYKPRVQRIDIAIDRISRDSFLEQWVPGHEDLSVLFSRAATSGLAPFTDRREQRNAIKIEYEVERELRVVVRQHL